MEFQRIKNHETYLTFPLLDSENYEPYYTSAWSALSGASIVSYSYNDSTSAVAHTITSTPNRIDSTGLWQLHLSTSETNPNSGNDDYMIIKMDAQEIVSQTMLIKLVGTDFNDVTDAIKLKTDNLPNDPASNTVVYSRLATSGYTTSPTVVQIRQELDANSTKLDVNIGSRLATSAYSDVSSDITSIKAQTDLMSFSGSNLNVRVLDSGILNDISVADILAGTVDTKTVTQILEILLAYANGRITVSGSNFTYYKQDNSTSLYTLAGSDTARTRS